MHGRMTLTDKFGFWSISGDTGKRSISIESKFGDVSIDAFTGITISAPNGDINIEGKNINITASNNINIEAGQAIKKDLDEYSWHILADVIGTAIGSIDLSFFRCLWDAILPPISGTLKIKSYRNLFLEADTGAIWEKDSDVDLNTIGSNDAEVFNVMFASGDVLLHLMMDVPELLVDITGSLNKKLASIGCKNITIKLENKEWKVTYNNGGSYGVFNIKYGELFQTTDEISEEGGNILDTLFTGERRNFLDTTEICDKSLETLNNNVVYENAAKAADANARQCLVDAVTLFIRIQNLATYCTNTLSELKGCSKSCAEEVYQSFISVWVKEEGKNIDKALIMKSAMANYYLKYINKSAQKIYELPDDYDISESVAPDESDIKLLDKIDYIDRMEGSIKRFFVTADDRLGTGVKDELTKFTEDIRFTTTSKQNKGGIRMCSSAYNAVELKDGKFEPIKGVAQFSDLDGFKALIKRKINRIK